MWATSVITALHDDYGMVTGFAKVTLYVTAEHELEDSMRRSEERFNLLVSQVKAYAIIALDLAAPSHHEHWRRAAKGLHRRRRDWPELLDVYSETDRRTTLPLLSCSTTPAPMAA